MEAFRKLLFGIVIGFAALSSAVAPAFALGGCGRNYHRNARGRCVWGGQNQKWCLKHTGHYATYVNGVYICYR
jgi:hypothetical protein